MVSKADYCDIRPACFESKPPGNCACGRRQNVVTFNMDEYVGLDPSHPQSYRSFMHENCQSRVVGQGYGVKHCMEADSHGDNTCVHCSLSAR